MYVRSCIRIDILDSLFYNKTGDNMKLYRWLKIKREYTKQIKNLPDTKTEKLVEKALKLYPQEIDISDGKLRDKKGFWSNNLSDARHNAEELNTAHSQDVDFMIWAIYSELHEKSLENFKRGIKTVSLSELSHIEISKRYIKSCLEADLY
jgi:hypothetical protein